MLALEGIKVVDLSRAGPGPFCTWILGDLGAEVIKVEAPITLGAREAGLFSLTIGKSKERDRTIAYWVTNRNKKSIGINLKSTEGLAVVKKLVEEADVVVEGFRPGVAKRLGIDYEAMNKINPRVIYCSIAGYGQTGPYRDLPGHDINYISFGGALSLIGEKSGKPAIPFNIIADYGGAGMHAAVGILSAVIARGKTGRGQYLDISLMDSVISLLAEITVSYFQHDMEAKRGEGALGGAYPFYNVYETCDGKFISLGCLEPNLWENLCKAIGKEEFIPFHFELEHNFSPPKGKKWREIASYLKKLFITRTRDEWFEFLSQRDVPVAKVLSLDETFRDAQTLHRQMVEELEHPTEGKVKQVGIAIKLSDTPGKVRSKPPSLGEHTDEILGELGYSSQSVSKLRESGAVA